MRHAITLLLASLLAIAGAAVHADDRPVIAVFTKNSTNPAYKAFRIGADKVASAAGARIGADDFEIGYRVRLPRPAGGLSSQARKQPHAK